VLAYAVFLIIFWREPAQERQGRSPRCAPGIRGR